MNATETRPVLSISTVCPTCDGDGRLMCHNCHGGGTYSHPCLACCNRGDEPSDTCDATGEVDPLAPLYRHPRAKQCTLRIVGGSVEVGYVRNGESLTVRFWSIEWAEAFLDKLDSEEARRSPRGGVYVKDFADVASALAAWLQSQPAKHERVMLLQNIANDLGLTVSIAK